MEIQELDDFPLKFSGEKPTLFFNHTDEKGVIASNIIDTSSSWI